MAIDHENAGPAEYPASRQEQTGGMELDRVVADPIAQNPAFGAFKEDQAKANSDTTPSSKGGDAYNLLATMLGADAPARMSTPNGDIPLRPDWLHKNDIDALMRSPAYQTDRLPQSNEVRSTVQKYFDLAYPGKARTDETGKPIQTPTANRPGTAPEPLRGKGPLLMPVTPQKTASGNDSS